MHSACTVPLHAQVATEAVTNAAANPGATIFVLWHWSNCRTRRPCQLTMCCRTSKFPGVPAWGHAGEMMFACVGTSCFYRDCHMLCLSSERQALLSYRDAMPRAWRAFVCDCDPVRGVRRNIGTVRIHLALNSLQPPLTASRVPRAWRAIATPCEVSSLLVRRYGDAEYPPNDAEYPGYLRVRYLIQQGAQSSTPKKLLRWGIF